MTEWLATFGLTTFMAGIFIVAGVVGAGAVGLAVSYYFRYVRR